MPKRLVIKIKRRPARFKKKPTKRELQKKINESQKHRTRNA